MVKRPTGRPRTRWKDGLEKGIRSMKAYE